MYFVKLEASSETERHLTFLEIVKKVLKDTMRSILTSYMTKEKKEREMALLGQSPSYNLGPYSCLNITSIPLKAILA